MLCLQASIGAVNDLADAEADRVGKPAKPETGDTVAVLSQALQVFGGELIE